MTAPSGYRAPEMCADKCGAKQPPAFVVERLIPGTEKRQAEFRCPKCDLLHVVGEGKQKKPKGGD